MTATSSAVQKQQNQNALIIDPGSYSIKVGFAIDAAPSLFYGPDGIIQNQVIINSFKFTELLNTISTQDLSNQQIQQLPLLIVVARQQLNLQELAATIFLNTGFRRLAFIYQDTAQILYQSKQTCLLLDFGYESLRLLLNIEGVTGDLIVLDFSYRQIDEQVKRQLGVGSDEELVRIKQQHYKVFDNMAVYDLLEKSVIPNQIVTINNVQLHSGELFTTYSCPDELLRYARDQIALFAKYKPKADIPIVLVGGNSLLCGMDAYIQSRVGRNPVINNRDRRYAVFIGAAALVGTVAPETLFFCEEEGWEDGARKIL